MEAQAADEFSERRPRGSCDGHGLQGPGSHRVLVLNFMGNKGGCAFAENVMFTLNRMHGSDVHVVCYENENSSERRCEDNAEHNRFARAEGSLGQPGDWGGLPFCIIEEVICDGGGEHGRECREADGPESLPDGEELQGRGMGGL